MANSRNQRRRKAKQRHRRSDKHVQFLNALKQQARKAEEELSSYSRQVSYDDLFTSFYNDGDAQILEPPYLPGKMYELWEESGILQSCVEAFVHNIHGYGWEIVTEEGVEEGDTENPEKNLLQTFFKQPNPEESAGALFKKVGRDYEVTGNAYLEAVRNAGGYVTMLFWMDAKRTRLLKLDTEKVEVEETLQRGDDEVKVTFERNFRKYAMLAGPHRKDIRYYKEFGDPRMINALDGSVWNESAVQEFNTAVEKGEKPEKQFIPATEVIHLKHGNGTYGVPRWIGTLLCAMGINRAEYVNFDLFQNQGIPPLVVTLAGGELTEESYQDLLRLFVKAKGYENFNKLLMLEADSTTQSLDGKEAVPKLEVKNLAEYRKEDAMFLSYLQDAREVVRRYGFRLSGLYLGDVKDHNYASAKVARETAEEQIFVPERNDFDEVINMKVVDGMGVKEYRFKSLGPVIQSSEELIQLISPLTEVGAFTVNELIVFCNENFGTALEQKEEDWANVPIPQYKQEMAIEKEKAVAATKPQPTSGGGASQKADAAEMAAVLKAVTEIEEAVKAQIKRNHAGDHVTH